jgi:hypothetical protein
MDTTAAIIGVFFNRNVFNHDFGDGLHIYIYRKIDFICLESNTINQQNGIRIRRQS